MPQIQTMALDEKPAAPRRAVTLRQTVEVPANHRLTINVPREIPAGMAILTLVPAADRLIEEKTPKNADGGTSPHPNSDALFAILSQIGGNIDIDELRTERLAKHIK